MKIHCRIIDPPRAVVHWRGTFRAGNGKQADTDILDLIEVRDGQIASLTTFFDTASPERCSRRVNRRAAEHPLPANRADSCHDGLITVL